MKRRATVVWLLVSAFLLPVASGAQTMDTIGLGQDSSGGNFLVDSKGMTLYYFTNDVAGKSGCNGGCAKAWPAFYAPTIQVSSPLAASDFGTIDRADGSKQTTYMGWPLYYWMNDKKPGDVSGEGVGKVWYTLKVPAYTVMIATDKALGNYLVDGKGMTLYWFAKDSPATSAGTGQKNPYWPAFAPSSFVVPSALNEGDFGTIVRGDGTQQATYKGYPLYYFVKDMKRGDATGQNVRNIWFVIDPDKFPVGNM